jgi:protease-4
VGERRSIERRGVVSGLISGVAAVASAAAAALGAGASNPAVAVVEIEGTPTGQPMAMSLFAEQETTLLELVETFDTLAFDDEFDGVVIRLKDAALGLTHVEELGAAIKRVREQGKRVHLIAENYGPSELMLGSFADEVILQHGGAVSLPGMYMEEMYLADTLKWAGVKAQLVQVGDYKGANEQMTRAEPSPQWDANINQLLDSMYANQRGMLASGRSMSQDELDKAMQTAWWADGQQAVDAGLIDAVVDLPQIRAHLGEQYGTTEVAWTPNPYEARGAGMDYSNPFALFGQLMRPQVTPRPTDPTIAVLHIQGVIVDGDSSLGGPFGGGPSVGSRTIRNAIEKIYKEDNVKGVVVRVDSPGGSAIASEVMWKGLTRLAEKKPVWVSVGEMAASGGYYVLSAGQKVYVNPSSIVGSIGVVGGKYALGELMGRGKINVVSRARGPYAALMSTTEPWDDSQVNLIRTKMKETYDLFASRVSAGRPGIDLSQTAEGRLFTGDKAVGLKMADAIGGLDDAVNDLAAHVGVSPDEVLHYPEPPSFEEMLENAFGGFVRAPGVAAQPRITGAAVIEPFRAVLGDRRFEMFRDALNTAALLQDERVLLVSPRVIDVR